MRQHINMRQADEVIESWQLIYGFHYTVPHCEWLQSSRYQT
jgi:hypothetical protein